MKVNNNISAVITNNQLLRTEDSLAASMERLSSGLKINHAKDNPSGMAISNKMKAQIDGLNQASRNSSDGSSVLEIADGALNVVTSMLQRMRELAVQAANGTNSQAEKEAIQLEVDKLKEEVDRVSSTTEFNTKQLLNGSLDNRCYSSTRTSLADPTDTVPMADMTRLAVSQEVPAGVYEFSVTPATQTVVTSSGFTFDKTSTTKIKDISSTDDYSGTVSFNGYSVEISPDDTMATVYQKLQDAAEKGEVILEENGKILRSKFYGSGNEIKVEISNPRLSELLGGIDTAPVTQGKDAKINQMYTKNDTGHENSAFSSMATYTSEGNHITIHEPGGFEMDFLLTPDPFDPSDPTKEPTARDDVALTVTTMGPMVLQIGANEGQQMSVKIPSCDTKSLYIDDLDVTTVFGAKRALSQLDEALSAISEVRSSLGAYTNRLDSATKSLDETSENMNSAISRISDVDMALEMTEYTRLNVLSQTATSALSQANELPQLALQLLG